MNPQQKKDRALVTERYAEAFLNLDMVHTRLCDLRAKASESMTAPVAATCGSIRPEGNIDDAPTVECLTPVRRKSLPEEFREALADLMAAL